MNRFSITILPSRVRLYQCTRDILQGLEGFYHPLRDVLCQTHLSDEITFYLFIKGDNAATHEVFHKRCISDGRVYHVIDIHEDVPGIDHVGIIHQISKRFVERQIPILYVNTYGHNLVFLSEEHMTCAMEVLRDIAYVSSVDAVRVS